MNNTKMLSHHSLPAARSWVQLGLLLGSFSLPCTSVLCWDELAVPLGWGSVVRGAALAVAARVPPGSRSLPGLGTARQDPVLPASLQGPAPGPAGSALSCCASGPPQPTFSPRAVLWMLPCHGGCPSIAQAWAAQPCSPCARS